MIEHEDIKILISAYIDGENTPEENLKVKEHLKTCISCQKYFKELARLSPVLQKWPDENLSPDLEQKLNKTFFKDSKEGQTMKRTTKILTMSGSGILVAVLVLMVSLKVYDQTGMKGRFKTATDHLGTPFQAKIRDRDSSAYLSKSESQQIELGKTAQYEPYYLGTEYEKSTQSQEQYPQGVTKTPLIDSKRLGYSEKNIARRAEVLDSNYGYWGAEESPIYGSIHQDEYLREENYRMGGGFHTEEYDRIYENQFLEAEKNPLSTFSIDVDTASYSNMRRFLTNNQLPPEDAVRIEEMINYFSYDYPKPKSEDPFSITIKGAVCPWNPKHKLALIGLQGKVLQAQELPPSNLVFLIDVSGSMEPQNKLPLLKSSFKLMVEQLTGNEQVAIVVYAGDAGLVLESTPGSNKRKILEAIDRLSAGGSTVGGEGIELAYKIAKENFIKGGNNRVILATDGDFNVGVSSDAELVRIIEEKRDQGIFLTILGFGMGNYKDAKMEKLADKGNGNYYYIDTLKEGKKVLVNELGSTLFAIAKDVKVQVEFNPAQVKAYRLVGYENRLLAKEDFNDDTKDAGELGAGHTVTALYEIVPADSQEKFPQADDLKYQRTKMVPSSDLMTVKLRYKKPNGNTSKLIQKTIVREELEEKPRGDFQFAAAVAEFGLLLRNSEFKENASYEHVLKAARASQGKDSFGYRVEFIELVEKARRLDSRTGPEFDETFDGEGIQFKGE